MVASNLYFILTEENSPSFSGVQMGVWNIWSDFYKQFFVHKQKIYGVFSYLKQNESLNFKIAKVLSRHA
jgi:hypothetical protein